jgi:hypothetical protein
MMTMRSMMFEQSRPEKIRVFNPSTKHPNYRIDTKDAIKMMNDIATSQRKAPNIVNSDDSDDAESSSDDEMNRKMLSSSAASTISAITRYAQDIPTVNEDNFEA